MAFGVMQWAVSLTIFCTVIIAIAWSTVYLSKKEHNTERSIKGQKVTTIRPRPTTATTVTRTTRTTTTTTTRRPQIDTHEELNINNLNSQKSNNMQGSR